MAISHEEPTSPTDPNRGLNVKVFMVVVAIAAVVVAVLLFLTVWGGGHKAMPEPTKTSQPANSRLTPPAIRPKPSPLHPVALQTSTRRASLR
jgi:cell division protein FtsN